MDDEIKLGRVGHYWDGTTCMEASICHVHAKAFDSEAGGELPRQVNVHGHDDQGNCFSRRGVPFGHTASLEPEFHLNRVCPDQK